MDPNGSADRLPEALAVLDGNWCGGYTRPSPHLYPHQWNWDSGFIALAHARHAPERARREIRSLFRGQWRNGMLPHIVFNPSMRDYFPGPEQWGTDALPVAPRGLPTSGITNPPVAANAALAIYRNDPTPDARAFLADVFPRLRAQHRYLYAYRDPRREGLAYIRHPWESGTDNSPAFDAPLAHLDFDPEALPPYLRKDLDVVAADQRPRREDYDRYIHLIQTYRRVGYEEEALARKCPFRVQDPLFNALLCRANEALIEIAGVLGEDAAEIREWRDQTARALDDRLWSEEQGLYVAYDLVADERLQVATASGFTPLAAGVPGPDRARRLLRRLESPGFSGAGRRLYRVPTHDSRSPTFEPLRYWRGPVWLNLNWLIHEGLRRYGYDAQANAVREDTLELVRRFGFREYFSPFRDAADGPVGGAGSDGFSWTAALYIDLLAASPSVRMELA